MISLKTVFRNRAYRFNALAGLLLSSHSSESNVALGCDTVSWKVQVALNQIRNPYLLSADYPDIKKPNISKSACLLAKTLIWGHAHFYPLVWLLSQLRMKWYKDSVEAADAFCHIHPRGQKVLCLPRSVFIAITSAKFKESGVLFIGCFLPSHHMHAWVIEDGKNAWRYDRMWINYTPISMMI